MIHFMEVPVSVIIHSFITRNIYVIYVCVRSSTLHYIYMCTIHPSTHSIPCNGETNKKLKHKFHCWRQFFISTKNNKKKKTKNNQNQNEMCCSDFRWKLFISRRGTLYSLSYTQIVYIDAVEALGWTVDVKIDFCDSNDASFCLENKFPMFHGVQILDDDARLSF